MLTCPGAACRSRSLLLAPANFKRSVRFGAMLCSTSGSMSFSQTHPPQVLLGASIDALDAERTPRYVEVVLAAVWACRPAVALRAKQGDVRQPAAGDRPARWSHLFRQVHLLGRSPAAGWCTSPSFCSQRVRGAASMPPCANLGCDCDASCADRAYVDAFLMPNVISHAARHLSWPRERAWRRRAQKRANSAEQAGAADDR